MAVILNEAKNLSDPQRDASLKLSMTPSKKESDEKSGVVH